MVSSKSDQVFVQKQLLCTMSSKSYDMIPIHDRSLV